MSQVIRKYSNGKPIKLDDNQLFQREGFGAYKREDIANNLAKGLEQFIADEKMNEKDAQMFRQIVGQAIEGTRNGQFTKMDTSGIHNTMNLNSNGITEGKKFLGINVGGQRAFDKSAKTDDGRNNALNALNRYYTKTLDSMSTYNYDNELKAYNEKNPKTKYNANTFFTDAISREWYGGNGIDWDNYSKNRTEEDRINLLNSIIDKTDYNELFNKYDWSGTNIKNAQDIANLYRALGTNLSNKTLDNGDYNAFAALGGTDLNQFLTGKKATETPIEDNPRVIREKALREEAKTKGYDEETANKYVEAGLLKYDRETNQKKEEVNEEYKNQQYLNWANEYSRNNPFKETIQSGFLPETLTYKPEELNNPIKDFYNNNVSDYLNDNLSRDWFKAGNTQHIANQLDFITNKLGYKLPDAGDGFVAIPSTYDFNNYSTIVYNPQTRQYKETSMLATDALKTLFKEYYDKNIVKHKEGGIIIMQFGGDIQNNYNKYLQQSKAEKENRKQQEVEAKAKSNNRTIQQQKESERKPGVDGEWTTEDKVILGSIVADIASMGASYVPVYGTLASAGLGIGSSLANYSAELSRNGFNLGDLGNLAINLGLDTVGLVPGFGSAAKGSKILKTAAKYLPRILATASLANTPEVYQSVKKAMTPGTDLTVDDWRNIAEGFKMAIQGGRGVKRTVQAHNLKKDLATGNKVLTTLGGKEVSVTPSQLSEISSHRKLEDQEAALQLLLKDNNLKLAGDLHRRWYNPIGWLPNSNIRNEYDFSKTKKVRTSKGDIDVPIIHSNSDKYIAATMQQSTAKIPGWDELTIKYNDWKYGSKENKNSKSGSKKSNVTKETGLVPTGKRNEFKEENLRQQDFVKNVKQKASDQANKRANVDDSTWKNYKGTIHGQNSDAGLETVNGRQLRETMKVLNALNSIDKFTASLKKTNINPSTLPAVISKPNIPNPITQKFKFSGIQEGIERASKQRLAKDMADTRIKRSVQQNTETVARKQAEEAKKNVDKAITMAMIPNYKKPLQGAPYKAKQTMYNKLFNQRYYDMQDAIRNRELPHKKSNKKKKTSKDNRIKRREWGGLLFKDGGLIPKFQSPAGPIRMQAKSKNYFDRNTGLSGYNFGADVDEFLKHGTAEDYVIGFNGREDNYDALTKASGGTYNNRSYISNPLATTVQSGMLTYNPGYDKYIRQNIQGYGVTEGQGTGTDTYLGDRTWERTLGRNITPEQAKYFNDTYLNQRGMELFDKGDGGYRLRLLSQIPSVNSKTTTEQKSTPATAPSTTSNTENGLVGTSNSTSKNPKGNFSLYPEDVLSLGRMLGGLYTNSRIAKLHKRGLKPLVEDPAEQQAILTGDISGKIASEQQANSISDAARQFGTSDAQTYLSGLLEAKSKEAPIRLQGIFRDIDAYNKSRYLVNQIANQNTVERVNKANKNRTAALAIDNAKNQIDASEISANYAQVLAPWLAGIENKYAQNRAALKQYQLESSMNNQAAAYQSELTSLYDKYKDNAVEFNKQKQLLDSKYKQLILDEKKSLISNPWLINFAKSGSKLGYKEKAALQRAKDFNKRLLEDNKRFHKDIMESKREHNKLLKHMSSLTAALIKKGLNL